MHWPDMACASPQHAAPQHAAQVCGWEPVHRQMNAGEHVACSCRLVWQASISNEHIVLETSD